MTLRTMASGGLKKAMLLSVFQQMFVIFIDGFPFG
jgi:hypothetical protein